MEVAIMAENKERPYGLHTPSMETQLWLEQAKRLIESKEIDWSNEYDRASNAYKYAEKLLDQEMRKPEGKNMDYRLHMNYQEIGIYRFSLSD
jgi:hypothetical protein